MPQHWLSILHDKIALICPIKSIRCVKIRDKSTWEILFEDSATKDQKVAAQKEIDNFDMSIIDQPIKSDIDILKERIAVLEAKTTTTTGTQK